MNPMNETLNTIAARYSCRAYDGRPVEKEKLEAVALAAVQAPSGMNRQPWQIVVITEKPFIEEMDAEGMRILASWEDKTAYERFMARGGSLFYNASVIFIILKQPDTELDTGIVTENIALAAHSVGLGNVICGMASVPLSGEKGTAFKEKIAIPEGYEFGMAVLAGYAKEPGGMPHKPDMGKIRML
jgi:nitroreductase